METTLIEVCALLHRLCREQDIEPPAMSLTFKSQWDRSKFEHIALKSMRDLSPFNHGGLTGGTKEVHGISLQLLAEHPERQR